MSDTVSLLGRVYDAFNKREVDTVLAAMHPAVDWPNGWEGGRVAGRDEDQVDASAPEQFSAPRFQTESRVSDHCDFASVVPE